MGGHASGERCGFYDRCSVAMLCFADDAALARVMIRATAVPRKERRAWLQALAARIEQGARPVKTSRDYTRAWRARERSGRCLLKLEMDEANLVVGLVDRGLLDPLKADNRTALTEAAQKALIAFCDGEASQREARIYDSVRVRAVFVRSSKEVRLWLVVQVITIKSKAAC